MSDLTNAAPAIRCLEDQRVSWSFGGRGVDLAIEDRFADLADELLGKTLLDGRGMTQTLRESWATSPRGAFRHTVLRLLRRFNPGTISVRHPWTGGRVYLDCFVHRNYWYHGRSRERSLMEWFADVLQPGNRVLELGGHIGYTAVYFAALVGDEGRVVVYEPGPNNLEFIRRNVAGKPNIVLQERAVGETPGSLPLYIESLSGMNNSFVEGFQLLASNQRYSGVDATVRAIEVEVVRIDDEFPPGEDVDFVKIDIEGFEYEALLGMQGLLARCRPLLALELNARHNEAIESLLTSLGYSGFDASRRPLHGIPSDAIINTLWGHSEAHAELLARVMLDEQ